MISKDMFDRIAAIFAKAEIMEETKTPMTIQEIEKEFSRRIFIENVRFDSDKFRSAINAYKTNYYDSISRPNIGG